ncbi:succinylglutamate desuccinylase/aspartoacylase family protein [Burkholderia anthina]|uniref:succinylglutamate desuccinylase/aspartoacylase family protein n=1 Tax=Burkholderia anthina TaxID=179879 RepID=UPI00158A524D|nr:succinylglutamate desuccinylase/aspartoacylase family protein [Burkholderia anthina]
MEQLDIPLPGTAPGMRIALREYTFGPAGAARSVYVQAALHAGEVPGLLVIQHLLERLAALEHAGMLGGRVAVMTWANPIGMQQCIGGALTGRFDCAGSGNFDRRFPDMRAVVARRIDAGDVPRSVRDAKAWLTALSAPPADAADPVDSLKVMLLHRAFAHDIALDLHCDKTAVMHVYGNWAHEARATALARYLDAPMLLLEDHAGGGTFDQAFHDAWAQLREHGVPGWHAEEAGPGFSAVVELRGQRDVSDALARGDADGLIEFLRTEAIVADRGAMLAHAAPAVAALEAVDHVKAGRTGIVCWKVPVGQHVDADAVIAEIVDAAANGARHRVAVRSRTSGMLVARMHVPFVLAGQRIAMIAGRDAIPGRVSGALLPD